MVKLCHKTVKSKMALQNLSQESLAEKLDISDRHIRNLCTKDTNASISLCYQLSKLFDTTIEDLLTIEVKNEK